MRVRRFLQVDTKAVVCHNILYMATNSIVTRIGAGGRVVIPAVVRRAIGLKVGDQVVIAVDGQEVRLVTVEHAIAQAQALVKKYVPRGRKLSDELIRQRRQEANDE